MRVTTHSAIIHRGKIRKLKGSAEKLINHIKKDEEIYEQTRVMDEKKQAKTDVFISKFRSGARSAGLVQSRIKMLAKKEKKEKLSQLPKINFSFPNIECSAEHLLRSYNITFGYNENLLIKNFSLDINNGDKIAIIGRNGKGKSTLLRLLASVLKPNSGHLKSYHSLTYGYFGDNDHNYHANETIISELAKVENNTETEIRKVAASLLFTRNDVKKNMQDLSGGEKARIQLGKLMLKKHHLLFLDEPSNHLDIESVQELLTGLKEYTGAMVFISHDERILSEVANKIVVFNNDSVEIIHSGYNYFLEKIGWGDEDLVEKNIFKKEKNKQL
jgi:ATP-binding cassette subfamily F protein 3